MEENAAMAAPKGMKMPRPSEEAKAAFARIVPDEPAITIKPMFGQMSAFVNGNMFCGIFGELVCGRLPAEDVARGAAEGVAAVKGRSRTEDRLDREGPHDRNEGRQGDRDDLDG